jgi:predicted DCC family thiol-disulfide oxidoreductase YuxK
VSATLLYDADCAFCRLCTALVLAADRRRVLRPLPLRDPAAPALTPGIDEAARMSSWHLAAPDGTVRFGGDAVAPLLRLVPGGTPAAALAERFPAVVDRAYRWAVRHRSALGRWTPPRARRWADRRIAIAQGL